jgi:hypothetical protein
MNYRGCGRKRSWRNLKYYSDIFLKGLRKTANPDNRIAILRTEIKTQVLQNAKQECKALSHNVR